MSSNYKTDQCHVVHRGRDFHFVSYEGQRADPARNKLPSAATWYLMSAGKRWEVAPEVHGQDAAELRDQLVQWLEDNVFVPALEPAVVVEPPIKMTRGRGRKASVR